jgi:hypothetical protein
MDVESRLGRSPMLITRVATFVAIGVVAGLALSAVPNVELVTAVCFTAGFLLGTSAGVLTGGLTEGLFAGLNPLGSSVGLLLVTQIAGMVFAGVAGALAANLTRGSLRGRRYVISVVGLGILSTLVFDILTNLAFPVMAGFSVSGYVITLVAGAPFAAIHLASNAVVFSVLVAPLLPRLRKGLTLQ